MKGVSKHRMGQCETAVGVDRAMVGAVVAMRGGVGREGGGGVVALLLSHVWPITIPTVFKYFRVVETTV